MRRHHYQIDVVILRELGDDLRWITDFHRMLDGQTSEFLREALAEIALRAPSDLLDIHGHWRSFRRRCIPVRLGHHV